MISFYSDNLIDQAEISASSENSLFPVSNLTHTFRTKVFRSTTNSDSVVFDFQETSEIDSIILVDNPRAGFGVSTVTLQLNGTNTWGSPAFSQVLTFNPTHGIAYAEFATQNYRFARLVMTSTLGYCELSKVFIGKKIAFDSGIGIDLGWSYQDQDLSAMKENSYGQKFVDVKTRRRRISFSIKSLNPDELDQVLEIYDAKSNNKPFFIRLGCDDMINDKDRFSGMYFMDSVPPITNKSFALYDISQTLEEAM
jgi:hypothetical protein